MTIADRSIELSSFTTGRTETPHGIRNSFAFDLRRAGNADGMAAAVVDLPESMMQQGAHVELRLPASDLPCAQLRGQNRLMLNAGAFTELKASAGAFFYVDVLLTSRTGERLAADNRPLDRFTLRIRRSKSRALKAAA